MESVALFLQKRANECDPGSEEFDLFGRSSFNRYYYATYGQVRSLLGSLNPSWTRQPHKEIPGLLRGTIVDTIKKTRIKSAKIADVTAVQLCQRARHSAHELARIMEHANAVRVVADYNPDIKVIRQEGDRFSLYEFSVTSAHDWSRQTQHHSECIKRAWRLNDK
jgi:hypothetical protein